MARRGAANFGKLWHHVVLGGAEEAPHPVYVEAGPFFSRSPRRGTLEEFLLPLDRRRPALDQLMAACCELVRRGRKGRHDDTEDVVQEACVHVLRLAAPRTVREPARFLSRITHNLWIDRGRRRKREAALFDSGADPELAPGYGLDPQRVASGEETLLRAFAAIDALPPRCREAFELHRFEGLSYVGIAHRMGISVSMVEKHIAEAMLRLSRALMAGEDDTPVGALRARGAGID